MFDTLLDDPREFYITSFTDPTLDWPSIEEVYCDRF